MTSERMRRWVDVLHRLRWYLAIPAITVSVFVGDGTEWWRACLALLAASGFLVPLGYDTVLQFRADYRDDEAARIEAVRQQLVQRED